MYCVMRASVPSLHNVYRRYDIYRKIAARRLARSRSPTSATLLSSAAVYEVLDCVAFSVLCFWEDYKLYYDSTRYQQQQHCPAVVSVVSPEIQSEDGSTWVIVDVVPLGENCDYTIHIVPRNETTGDNSIGTFPPIS